MNHKFNISDLAASKIKDQLVKRNSPNANLRLGVKGTGCLGYSYFIEYDDSEPKVTDLIFNLKDVTIVIDKKSIVYLNNSVLDWRQSLMEHGFHITNPNASSSCGCSKSFSI